jgi:phosphotransferase system enzyme I (PtsI)
MSTRLQGRGASPGAALAPVFLVLPRAAPTERAPGDRGKPDEEYARAVAALDATEEALIQLSEKVAADAGEEEAAIFMAHADFAADPELRSRVRQATREGQTAEDAVINGFEGFRAMLAASSSEYLAARAADLDDVRDQVLDELRGVAGEHAVPTERVVVVAKDITPSQTARLPKQFLGGIACEAGSPTSHAAILARSLGIPAVVGVTGILEAVQVGGPLAIDGDTGEVIVDPDEHDRAAVEDRIQKAAEQKERLSKLVGEHGQTADGRTVELAANVNDPGALERAGESGAQGSGLVRTEFMFMESSQPPSVEEQTEYYRRVLAAFPGERVVIRTMDIGADKPLPFVRRDPEENPALGVRGLRLGFAIPHLLHDQLRALLRASDAGRLAVMFPMVSREEEVVDVLRIFDEIAAEEGTTRPEVGVMIEVPAAALAVRRIVRHLNFVSVGTNDLLQYLYAADRLLAEVAQLPEIFDPDVLRLLGDIVAGAHENGAWVGVCGEAAADPATAAALVGLGVDELSMTPMAIPLVKDTLRRLTSAELEAAVSDAIAAPTATASRELLESLVRR